MGEEGGESEKMSERLLGCGEAGMGVGGVEGGVSAISYNDPRLSR